MGQSLPTDAILRIVLCAANRRDKPRVKNRRAKRQAQTDGP